MTIVCRNCQAPLGPDRFCERCGAQGALPATEGVDPDRIGALYELLQEVRQTGPEAAAPETAADESDRYVRMLMSAIAGSEQDYVAAGSVKFLGAAIPEDRHPMRAIFDRLDAGAPIESAEMEAAMSRFAEIRAGLTVEQRHDRPLAELDETLRRLTGLRIALTPMLGYIREPAQHAFVQVQQIGIERRIAGVAVEMEMMRRSNEAESTVAAN
ncbi:MAG TPA: hypothetical protein VGT61_10015 [Thermomicrobiales bacterium]|jgi:hypothetical protein|nr:hypothetical protein [Thermomicrobiales bacterium]